VLDALGLDISADAWAALALWAGGVGAAALGGAAAHVVLFAILRRLTRRTEGSADTSAVRHLSAPAWLLLPVAGALMVAPPGDALPIVGVARHALVLALIYAVAWALVALTYVADDLVRERWDIRHADNLHARKVQTKVRIFRKVAVSLVIVLAVAAALMTFPAARQLGASILASAGIAGLVVGLAARPLLSNLIAGVQIALTETLNIDDVVIVKGEWGRIEEIASTYVVVRIWDLRRLVVPINFFVEEPFENWTRTTADLLGTVFIHCDYTVPVDDVRRELKRILDDSGDLWDGKAWGLVVTDATERTMTLRALMSAADSSKAWDLRCRVREKLIDYLQREHPDALPRLRAETLTAPGDGAHHHAR